MFGTADMADPKTSGIFVFAWTDRPEGPSNKIVEINAIESIPNNCFFIINLSLYLIKDDIKSKKEKKLNTYIRILLVFF
jgi:hypothetical protein